jgi:hypothetical protein
MGNTPNNNFPFPESTDLVKDGAQAIEDLADAIDTTLGVYSPATPMGVHLSTVTFSGVASQSFSNVFDTAVYNQWRVIADVSVSATASNLRLRARANVTDATTGVFGASYFADFSGSAAVFSSSNNQAQATIAPLGISTSPLNISFDVFLTSSRLMFHGTTLACEGAKAHFFGFTCDVTNPTGFTFLPSANNITGSCSIFGYNK